MKRNRIRELRLRSNLTQKQLAEASGSSQQQIQRIEAGIQSPRFELALKISEALGTSIDMVFPSTKKPILSYERRKKKDENIYLDEKFVDGMQSAGIDMVPENWFFKYRLRGGAEGILSIGGEEKKRLWNAVQRTSHNETYIAFQSVGKMILLNLDHLIFCHFLFEGPFLEDRKEEDTYEIEVYIAEDSKAYQFEVDPDETDLSDESAHWEHVQFQNLIYHAETFIEKNDIFLFKDSDGETAVFRAEDVAMINMPLLVVSPDYYRATFENYEE